MDTFKLNIDLGNASMSDANDVAEALQIVAERLLHSEQMDSGLRFIYDVNGNSVGKFEFVSDAER
jgi:hypothetical protein